MYSRFIVMIVSGVFFWVIGIGVALAQPACGNKINSCTPNGCGPGGYWGVAVPDNIWGLCKFKTACDRHDKCYSRCDAKCGDLAGCSTCKLNKNGKVRLARKRRCDEQFYKDIKSLNSNNLLPSLCNGIGNTYRTAVRKGGHRYWNGRELPPGLRDKIRGEVKSLENLAALEKANPGSVNWQVIFAEMEKRETSILQNDQFLNVTIINQKPTFQMKNLSAGNPSKLNQKLIDASKNRKLLGNGPGKLSPSR